MIALSGSYRLTCPLLTLELPTRCSIRHPIALTCQGKHINRLRHGRSKNIFQKFRIFDRLVYLNYQINFNTCKCYLYRNMHVNIFFINYQTKIYLTTKEVSGHFRLIFLNSIKSGTNLNTLVSFSYANYWLSQKPNKLESA